MNLIFESEEQLNNYIGKLRYINTGSEGSCYQDKNEVLKIYEGCSELSGDELLKFEDINIPSFVFTKKLILVKDCIRGSVMDFKKGLNLDNYINSPHLITPIEEIELSILIEALNLFFKDVILLNKSNISADDIYYTNILFSGLRFYAIDTDSFTFSKANDLKAYANILFDFCFSKDLLKLLNQKINYAKRKKYFLNHPFELLDILSADEFKHYKSR